MAGHGSGKRLGDGSNPSEDAAEGLGHVVEISTYNKVFLALIVLTGLTVWAACQPVGVYAHIFIALLIATIKATIVGLVFMHLKFEKMTTVVVALCPFVIFVLLILGTLGDLMVKERVYPASVAHVENFEMPSTVELDHK